LIKSFGLQFVFVYYEGQYNDAAAKVDEVAERLLQLDARPENRFSEYLKQSQLKEAGFEAEKMEGLKYILDTLKVIIVQERRVLAAAQEAEDEVTVALMDDYLTGQEKNVWMLVATLS
jgi:DNA-binding ferritin-like protein (oxidative damage protectant)